jgi:hypothetical protein
LIEERASETGIGVYDRIILKLIRKKIEERCENVAILNSRRTGSNEATLSNTAQNSCFEEAGNFLTSGATTKF